MADPVSSHSTPTVPADDPSRRFAIARPESGGERKHVCVAGDTYTILLEGNGTGGKYCLIDMFVPPGGGPPLHRHDFEEMFSILEGEAEFTFRGEKHVVRAGETVNVPANAPHHFTNASDRPMRMLCMCAPAGQDAFFLEIGDRVASRTAAPPAKSEDEKKATMQKSLELAPKYRTELLV